jgi:hypothetical protein
MGLLHEAVSRSQSQAACPIPSDLLLAAEPTPDSPYAPHFGIAWPGDTLNNFIQERKDFEMVHLELVHELS